MVESRELNSVDIEIIDGNGKVVGEYQSKYGATASETSKQLDRGDYGDQKRLVPEGHSAEVSDSTEVIEVDGVGEAGRPVVTTVFTPGADGPAVPAHHPHCLPDLVHAGFDASLLDQPHLDPVRATRWVTR